MDMQKENGTGVERRDVLRGGLKLGAAAGFAALVLGAGQNDKRVFAQTTQFKTDIEVLNYALTLEFFETELYKALLGLGKLQGKDRQYVELFGQQEAAHVTVVRTTIEKLGGTPVKQGQYNFGAAGPLNTREDVLKVLATVEGVGVSAYQGAAGFIQNPDILAAAASIMQVEGRHTAVIRQLAGMVPVPDAFTKALSPDEVLKIVAPFIKS